MWIFFHSAYLIDDRLICTSMQDIAHYRFSPAVTTHTQIEDCSISTSFYTLAGKSDVEKVSVESIIGEVYT